MKSVGLGSMQHWFNQYDKNRDGRMSGQELAYASTNLSTQGAKNEARLFGKMAPKELGGQGLLPDFNHDGALDQGELARLTNMHKSDNKLGLKDFKKLFPGGNTPFSQVQQPQCGFGAPMTPPVGRPGQGGFPVAQQVPIGNPITATGSQCGFPATQQPGGGLRNGINQITQAANTIINYFG